MDRKYANGFQVENVGLNMRRFSWPTASVGPNRLTGAWTTPSADITNVACWHKADLRLPAPEGPLTSAFRTLAMGHFLHDLVNAAEGLDVHAVLTPSPDEG